MIGLADSTGTDMPEILTGEALKKKRLRALGIGCGALIAVPILLIVLIFAIANVQLWRVQRKAGNLFSN